MIYGSYLFHNLDCGSLGESRIYAANPWGRRILAVDAMSDIDALRMAFLCIGDAA